MVSEDVYPLSFMQQGMLFHSLYNRHAGVDIEQMVIALREPINAPLLQQSWLRVIGRHAVLRTAFRWDGEQPLQEVRSDITLPWQEVDCQSDSKAEWKERLSQFLEEDRRCGFDMSHAPLMRFTLFRLAEADYRFVWSFHHAILDGRAFVLVLNEVSAYYQALQQGTEPSLDPPRPYQDYVSWLHQQDFTQAEAYWRANLAGVEEPCSLAAVFPQREESRTVSPHVHELRLSEATTSALRALAHQLDVTPNTLLQGAWAVLLSRYTGKEDVVFGVTRACRKSALNGADDRVGIFINTLPLRVHVPEDVSLAPWLLDLRAANLEVRPYEHTPLLQIQRWSSIEANASLFDTLLVFENFDLNAAMQRQGEEWKQRSIDLHEKTNFPLSLTAYLNADLLIKFTYDPAHFTGEETARMAGHLQTLLEAILADPHRKLSQLNLLSEGERHRLLVEFNDSRKEYPRDLCVHQLFEQQVARTPEAIAVEFEGRSLTYQELDHKANQLASLLRHKGAGPDVPIGIYMRRSLDMIVGLLGILKAGSPYVPLDPAYPQERLAFMLEDARSPVLLSQTDLGSDLAAYQGEILCLDTPWQTPHLPHQAAPRSGVTPNHLAYIIYTSGSTGRPKGVAMGHDALVNMLKWQQDHWVGEATARTLQYTSLSFDVSFQEIGSTLSSGGTLVLVADEVRRDSEALLGVLERDRIARLYLPFVALSDLAQTAISLERYPQSLREIITAGEQLQVTPALVQFMTRLSGCTLSNHYGPTECHAVSAYHVTGDPSDWPALPPIGVPIANTQLYILDRQLRPVPMGVPGELYSGGAAMAHGYLHRPELTQERFVADPFSSEPGARLYKSGDLCRYLPDGNIEYLGRLDHQVKIRGFRIELGEIESRLREHPGIAEAAVLVREDRPGQKRLVAYLVGKAGEVEGPELRAFLKERLPEYMVPAAFVALEALPLSPNGKTDRRALAALHADRDASLELVAPRTPTEEILAGIWEEVLSVHPISVTDNFFEIGGHSLLATRVFSRIRNVFETDLPVRTLFENPTLEQLARTIEAARQAQSETQIPPLVPVRRDQVMPLSFSQQRLWFLDQLETDSFAYNVPLALRLTGKLDRESLESSLNELRRRHESLRTVFATTDNEPIQKIQEFAPVALEVIPLSSLEPQQRQADAERLMQQESRKPFDLEHGPLFRASLLELAEQEHILMLTMHHIVSDGWSMGVLTRELRQLYSAFCAGQPSPLPELAIQYADYAVWQRGWLKGEELERQVSYWKEHLSGAPTLLELPTDRPRPPVQTLRGAVKRFMLSSELTQALKALGQREGATLFMTLLAAFDVLLSRYTGQEDVVVGTAIANRTRTDVEGLIGFFINALALRTDLSGDPDFVELLGRVREAALGAYAHQDLPFEKLVEELQPQRNLSHSPIFQVALAVQNAPQEAIQLEGLRLKGIVDESVTAKYDLLLIISEMPDGLRLSMEYNTDLFDAVTIERMLGHFETLLKGVAVDPRQKISRLPLLTETERDQLFLEFNDTAAEYPQEKCLHQLFEEQVQRTPEATAVVFGEQTLTYAQLNARANQLAHALIRQGVGPDVLVGLYVERSLEMVIGILGILKAGGAYLPLDPAYPPERLAFMLKDSRTELVLTQQRLLIPHSGDASSPSRPEDGWREAPHRRVVHGPVSDADVLPLEQTSLPEYAGQIFCLDADWKTIATESEQNPQVKVDSQNLAYVIYTSGSTGRPKGVLVPHRGVVNLAFVLQEEFEVTAQSRVLQFASLNFDASLAEVEMALTTGAALHLTHQDDLTDVTRLTQILQEQAITTVTLPPSYLALMSPVDLPHLKTLCCAGEACPPELAVRWSVGRLFLNGYGPTEGTVAASYYPARDLPEGALRVPLGQPNTNARLYLLDRNFQPVPCGVAGELYIGGAGVTRGYLHRPDLTAEKFVPDPFSKEAGDRLYRTGDLCRWLSDGNLEFVGRVDDQVKVRGFRIELGEIESVLSGHPDVGTAAVIAREDTPGDKRLVAYITPAPKRRVEWWPSVAEYYIYDDVLYYAMTHDERRNQAYRVALERTVKDKIVVEIGPGKDAILSRLCIEAGASKVYTIELLEETYLKAKACLQSLGLTDRIHLIHGDARKVELPELGDVCVSEIVGAIGGSEGAALLINDVRRLLKPGGRMIPERSLTQMAAVSLPDEAWEGLGFSSGIGGYVEQIFDQVGYPFDLRVCLKGLDYSDLISTVDAFEDLDYTRPIELEEDHPISMSFTRDARMDGFLVWLKLFTEGDEAVDILEHEHCWLPVFLPVFTPGRKVRAGDRFEGVVRRRLCENGLNPDYHVEGKLIQTSGEVVEVAYSSWHFQQVYCSNAFYDRLFAENKFGIRAELSDVSGGISLENLRQHLTEKLPAYMHPSALVVMDALPLSPNGKVDRKALPAPDASHREENYAAPRTPIEEGIAEIWRQVLRVEHVGVHERFFELGGHSLLATQVISRILNVFQVELPLQALFEAPTVAGLAKRVEGALDKESAMLPPLVRSSQEGRLPLSFAQRRLWFIHQLDPLNPGYNLLCPLRLEGQLDIPALQTTLQMLVERHSVLRTIYVEENGVPGQVVLDTMEIPFHSIDLSDRSQDAHQEALRLVMEEFQIPFNLETGPILRAVLYRLSPTEHILGLTMHHIASDGWSVALIVQEIAELYTHCLEGSKLALQELSVQYTDYALWQRQCQETEAMQQQLAYWRKQLEGAPATMKLPFDRPRPRIPSLRGASLTHRLAAPLVEGLQGIGRQEGATLFMTLLACFDALLYCMLDEEDVVVGTDIAGRNRAELEELVGFFINHLVLRTNVSGNPSFRELVSRVRGIALEAYSHQDMPFDQLVEVLQPERETAYTQLFQVLFVMQNMLEPVAQNSSISIKMTETEFCTSKFDLALFFREDEQDGDRKLLGQWVYSTDLFDMLTIRQMAERLETVVSKVVATPEIRLNDLKQMLRRSEQEQSNTENYSRFQRIKPLAQNVKKISLEEGR